MLNQYKDNNTKTHLLVLPPAFTNNRPHEGHMYYLVLAGLVCQYYREKGYYAPFIVGYDTHGIAIKLKLRSLPAYTGQPLTLAKRFCLQSISAFKELLTGLKLNYDYTWSTEDLEYHLLVDQFFKTAYQKGLLERTLRVQEWCPNCKEYLSSVELTTVQLRKMQYAVSFTVVETGQEHTLMTTKPAYLCNVLAVLVNSHLGLLVGKTAYFRIVNKAVPILLDDSAVKEGEFNAMMVAGLGSLSDCELLTRHNLIISSVISPEKSTFNNRTFENYQELSSLKAEQIQRLLLAGVIKVLGDEPSVSVIHGERSSCRKQIEYSYSLQTYLKTTRISKQIQEAAERVVIYPDKYRSNLNHLLANLQDWCLSRSYAWASHMPVVKGERLKLLSDINAEQLGEQYLDCWFESAIAWLYTSKLVKKPIDYQIQGYQILTKWAYYSIVAAVVMGYKVPFNNLRLTSLLRTAQGKKYSKSTGAVSNPMALVETYGLPALRLWVASLRSDADMLLNEGELLRCKRICNKIKNLGRYLEIHKNVSADDPSCQLDLAELDKQISFFLTQALSYRLDSISTISSYVMESLSQKLLSKKPSRQQLALLTAAMTKLEVVFKPIFKDC